MRRDILGLIVGFLSVLETLKMIFWINRREILRYVTRLL